MGPVDVVFFGLLLLASWSAYVCWTLKNRFKLLEQKIERLEDDHLEKAVQRLNEWQTADRAFITEIFQYPPLREWVFRAREGRSRRASPE